ncbi:hypothetical protein X769_22425 [Mesorhizobium sp. LSJC268A00]|nr:hypothetical protein X769_22425 [Mesorhizobium sp. LSJC268A00]
MAIRSLALLSTAQPGDLRLGCCDPSFGDCDPGLTRSLLASHGKDHRLQRINVVGKGKTR